MNEVTYLLIYVFAFQLWSFLYQAVVNALQVGVHELGIRRAILQEVENFLAATKVDATAEV